MNFNTLNFQECMWQKREELKNQVLSMFSSFPEVTSLRFFGREAEGIADEYSDFDIVVVSSNLKETQVKYRNAITSISPIIGIFPLESCERQFTEMISLKDFSPYHKIDISIVDNINSKSNFKPFITVYEAGNQTHSDSVLEQFPITKNTNHQLMDILFSVPRFTKCIFRKDYDLYRRWIGVVRNLFILLFEKYSGWESYPDRKELSPPQAKSLYKLLNHSDKTSLNIALPLSEPLVLQESFRQCVVFYSELSEQKAAALNQHINTAFVKHILNFLDAELLRAKEIG